MRFGVLGRLQVTGADGLAVPLPAARQRALLVALLHRANRVVSAESLADSVWDGEPPSGATRTIRSYVMRLRKALGPEIAARIETRDPGYLIRVEAGELDADVLETLYAKVGAAIGGGSDWGLVAATAAEALALRREAPLIDVPSRSLRDAWSVRLEQQLVQLTEWRLTAEVESGNGHLVLPEARTLVQQHPLREESHRLLMLCLAQAGHTGEALAAYREARGVLVDQLGVEPGKELTELHRRILAGEVVSRATPVVPRPAPRTGTPPRQLPNDIRTFIGRDVELERLSELAEATGDTAACETVVLTMLEGMGGVGKSALAVRAAHRMSDRFPDGQLFVDLRGHTPGLEPLPAQDALEWLLRSMSVPLTQIPRGLAERAALYRSTLTGTRTLILLDNAASAAQVRPLIPAEPGCLVMVTSRTSLAGLDDAHFVGVGLLTDAEALELLGRVAGPGRVRADDPAAVELVRLCGGLPLAVRIAAAHLRHRNGLSIADYVSRLTAAGDRLVLLSDEDRSLTAVFASSFEGLPPDAQRLFVFLGLIPGPDFDPYAAAHLLDRDPRTAEYLLELLLGHNLVIQRTPGRYALHDLVRSYARGLLVTARADADRAAAVHAASERLLDYYQHTATVADRLRDARFIKAGSDLTRVPPHVPEFPDRASAAAWLRLEQANILAAITDAESSGDLRRVTGLTQSISGLLFEEGPQDTAVRLHAVAAEAARVLGRTKWVADHLLALGEAQRKVGLLNESMESLGQARTLFRDLGERDLEAYALYCQGRNRQASDDATGATTLLEESLTLAREAGDLKGQGDALATLGRLKQARGEMTESLAMKERAVALFREADHRPGEAGALHELGRAVARLGDVARAAELYEDALSLFLEIGQSNNAAYAYWELGRLLIVTGDFAEAQRHFERAFEVFERDRFRMGEAYLHWEFGRVDNRVGRPREAALRHQRALAMFRAIGMRIGEANVLHELAKSRHSLGGRKTAEHLLDYALELFRLVGDPDGQAEVLNTRGSHAAEAGDPEAALAFHVDALALAVTADSPLEQARAYDGAARARRLLGEREQALTDLREAVALYRRIGAAERHEAATRLAEYEAGQS